MCVCLLLYLALKLFIDSLDAEGLFLVHAEEEDIAAAEHWLATESTQCIFLTFA